VDHAIPHSAERLRIERPGFAESERPCDPAHVQAGTGVASGPARTAATVRGYHHQRSM
jgi:hypothetical protein